MKRQGAAVNAASKVMLGAAAAALVLASAIAVAPALGQNERTTGGFDDPVPTTRMRTPPRLATAAAVGPELIEGYSARAIAAFTEVPAIVVSPAGLTQAEKDEFSRTFRATPDGYFARLTGDDHDVIINGTLAYTVPPESLRFQRRSGAYFVQKGIGETDVSFSQFGGDYLIQFVCHEYTETEGGCVTDAEAVAMLNRMVPLGGGIQ